MQARVSMLPDPIGPVMSSRRGGKVPWLGCVPTKCPETGRQVWTCPVCRVAGILKSDYFDNHYQYACQPGGQAAAAAGAAAAAEASISGVDDMSVDGTSPEASAEEGMSEEEAAMASSEEASAEEAATPPAPAPVAACAGVDRYALVQTCLDIPGLIKLSCTACLPVPHLAFGVQGRRLERGRRCSIQLRQPQPPQQQQRWH